MLKFDNVSFQYDVEDFSIIDHLSFDVQDGEFVSVIGASGCGKSTIFRLVNKLLLPASGEILVDGESIEKKRNYCGYMPQQDLLFPWRTVRENLLLPMEIRGGYSKTEMREKADAALESVGLKDWGDKMPKELSGGMRQILDCRDLLRLSRRIINGFSRSDLIFCNISADGHALFKQADDLFIDHIQLVPAFF